MAAFNKIEVFVKDLAEQQHDLSLDNIDVYLSNAAPSTSADEVKTDITEIGGGNGYTAGGTDTLNTGAEATGTYTLTGTKVVITASGGTIGPFQYVVLFNDTTTSPLDALMGWWDRGSALTLQDGESFSIKFNSSDTTGDILTRA